VSRPRPCLGLVALALTAGLLQAAPAPDDEKVRLEVVIKAEDGGEPIDNATVYVNFVEERLFRKDKKRQWIGKTNSEGATVFPALKEGKVLIQVIAKGWKTFGQEYELRGPKHTIEIKLKPPKKWY
jgi:hypothetical protein